MLIGWLSQVVLLTVLELRIPFLLIWFIFLVAFRVILQVFSMSIVLKLLFVISVIAAVALLVVLQVRVSVLGMVLVLLLLLLLLMRLRLKLVLEERSTRYVFRSVEMREEWLRRRRWWSWWLWSPGGKP